MNFQSSSTLPPLRVLVVNPLVPAAKLVMVKILSGYVFGSAQLVDLTILVFSNEKPSGEVLKLELTGCAFLCTNSIEVSSDLPSLTDADVFCFMTNFKNPNCLDFENINTDEHFDTLYLLIKLAYSLSKQIDTKYIEGEKEQNPIEFKRSLPEKKIRKPIIIADGLVAIDILKTLSRNLPHDIFFCPTSLPTIAMNVLSDHIKVQCNEINNVFVWAANDEVFHVEIEDPLIITEKIDNDSHCDKEIIDKKLLKSYNLDHTQFSASWLKKEFIEKIRLMGSKNPYGNMLRAAKIGKTLHAIWNSRSSVEGLKSNVNIGIISDGSLGTIKGYPYILPLVHEGGFWCVNKCFEESIQLKNEIKNMNKTVIEHHRKLIPYCQKFLMEYVDNQSATPRDDESYTACLTLEPSSRCSTHYNY